MHSCYAPCVLLELSLVISDSDRAIKVTYIYTCHMPLCPYYQYRIVHINIDNVIYSISSL